MLYSLDLLRLVRAVMVHAALLRFGRAEDRVAALAVQAIIAQVVLVGTLFLVTALRPYSRGIDNQLQMASLVGNHISTLATIEIQSI